MANVEHAHDSSLREQLETLRQDVKELGRLTKDETRGQLHSVKDRGREYLGSARGRLGEAEKSFSRGVRHHPIRSLLIAAGAGALIGLLTSRR